MKSIKTKIVLIILLFTVVIEAFSNPVDIKTAEVVAQNYMNLIRKTSNAVSDIVIEQFEGQNSFYVVNFREGGWVMVSADNSTVPVFAYSHSGIYKIDGDKSDGFLFFVSKYKEQVNIAKKKVLEGSKVLTDIAKKTDSTESSEIAEMWNQLITGENSSMLRSPAGFGYGTYTPGNLLLYDAARGGEVSWGQSYNNDGGCTPSYNMYVKSSSSCSCGRTPTGCAAVAIGQMMWYWKWPRFNWDLMPAKLHQNQIAEGNEIATLLKAYAGVVNTIYTCAGSFALPSFMATGLKSAGFKAILIQILKAVSPFFPTPPQAL